MARTNSRTAFPLRDVVNTFQKAFTDAPAKVKVPCRRPPSDSRAAGTPEKRHPRSGPVSRPGPPAPPSVLHARGPTMLAHSHAGPRYLHWRRAAHHRAAVCLCQPRWHLPVQQLSGGRVLLRRQCRVDALSPATDFQWTVGYACRSGLCGIRPRHGCPVPGLLLLPWLASVIMIAAY